MSTPPFAGVIAAGAPADNDWYKVTLTGLTLATAFTGAGTGCNATDTPITDPMLGNNDDFPGRGLHSQIDRVPR